MSQSAARVFADSVDNSVVDNSVYASPIRVLIADDCPDIQHALAFRLSSASIEIDFASDGRECVDKALEAMKAGNPYDVVVLDVLMPILDGFSTAMLLKENECCTKIISMTERGMFCDESESIQAGCDKHFKKHDLYRDFIPYLEKEFGYDSQAAIGLGR